MHIYPWGWWYIKAIFFRRGSRRLDLGLPSEGRHTLRKKCLNETNCFILQTTFDEKKKLNTQKKKKNYLRKCDRCPLAQRSSTGKQTPGGWKKWQQRWWSIWQWVAYNTSDNDYDDGWYNDGFSWPSSDNDNDKDGPTWPSGGILSESAIPAPSHT